MQPNEIPAFIALRLRDVASFNGCVGTRDGICCELSPNDPVEWCKYCVQGEAAKIIEQSLRAAALDAAPSSALADQQIAARFEQIHQKLVHAEALTVGDVVFLFDLVRTLRSDGGAEIVAKRDLFVRLRAANWMEARASVEMLLETITRLTRKPAWKHVSTAYVDTSYFGDGDPHIRTLVVSLPLELAKEGDIVEVEIRPLDAAQASERASL